MWLSILISTLLSEQDRVIYIPGEATQRSTFSSYTMVVNCAPGVKSVTTQLSVVGALCK